MEPATSARNGCCIGPDPLRSFNPAFLGKNRGAGVPVQITFPSAESSDATAHARELRGELVDLGLPPDQLRMMRSSPENMDLGTTIEIAKMGIDLILAGHAAFSLAQVISNYAKRTRSTVNIKSDLGNIDISTERSDVTELAAILKKIAELHRDKADQ
jgi:hypothetical protein